ncbi:MAG: phosphotransferase [Phycisphaerae bacterium]|nr:phosphotransferase [Phycisphaerae bacterium]
MATMRRLRGPDWGALRYEIEAALRKHPAFPDSVRVDGRLRRLDAGLNHDNYVFWLAAKPRLPDALNHAFILRKCRWEDKASYKESVARLPREAAVLEAMASQPKDFDVPRFVCFAGDEGDACDALIETAVPGLPLSYTAKFAHRREFVISVIAQIASGVHRLPVDDFECLHGHRDATEHVQALRNRLPLDILADEPDAVRALRWIDEHLPEGRRAVVLHGDLLPQNIQWDLDDSRLGLIDWEYAQIGDPAYDLAIVTRGNAKLCGLGGGARRLVAAYREAGGAPITPADVMLHELLLVLEWLGGAARRERRGKQEGYPPQHYRDKIRGILARVESVAG